MLFGNLRVLGFRDLGELSVGKFASLVWKAPPPQDNDCRRKRN